MKLCNLFNAPGFFLLGGWEKDPPSQSQYLKIWLSLLPEKIFSACRFPLHHLNLFHPHQKTIFMLSLNAKFIFSSNHCYCIILFTLGFMYRYVMLVLINWFQYLLMLFLASRKGWMAKSSKSVLNQSPSMGKFPVLPSWWIYSPYLNAIWKILHVVSNVQRNEVMQVLP